MKLILMHIDAVVIIRIMDNVVVVMSHQSIPSQINQNKKILLHSLNSPNILPINVLSI